MKRRIEEEQEPINEQKRTLLDQLVEQDRAEFTKSVRKQLDQAEVFQVSLSRETEWGTVTRLV